MSADDLTRFGARGWLPIAALAFVSLSFGGGHVFARFAFNNGVAVSTAALTRTGLVTLALAVFLLARGVRLLPVPRTFRGTLVLGVLVAIQTFAIQKAVQLMPVAVALLLFYLFPFFTGVVASWMGATPFTRRLGIALAGAFAGLVLVLDVGSQSFDPLGIAFAVAAAATFTGILLLTPRITPGLAGPVRSFYTLATAAILFLVLAVAQGGTPLPTTTAGWVGLIGLSVCYGLGAVTMFTMIAIVEPVRAAVVMNLEPVIVALLGWAVLGEALAPNQMFGATVVVAAVIFYQVAGARRQ